MKKITILFLSILLIGCAKKELKIPAVSEKGIQELHNHSQVWIFFDIENNDTIAKVNRKNTISTTHWIYNIDKNLPLKAIIPSINKLKYKHANGIHSKEGMHNYFSYSDTISKKLSFLEFDNVIYKTDSLASKQYIKDFSEDYLNFNNINITINPTLVYINDSSVEQNDFKETLLEFIDFSAEGKQTMLHLNFNEHCTYQQYLHYKTMFNNLKNEAILINNLEFIFDPKKIPDCGCK